jgi:hypothetical protein
VERAPRLGYEAEWELGELVVIGRYRNSDQYARLRHANIGTEINLLALLVLDTSPQSIDEVDVAPSDIGVHADGDPALDQHAVNAPCCVALAPSPKISVADLWLRFPQQISIEVDVEQLRQLGRHSITSYDREAYLCLKRRCVVPAGRLLMVSPSLRRMACPLSGRNSTTRLVQILQASSARSSRNTGARLIT